MKNLSKYLIGFVVVAVFVGGVFLVTSDKAEAEVSGSGFTFSASISEIKDLACVLFDKCPKVAEEEEVVLGAIAGTTLPEQGQYGEMGYKNVKQPWGAKTADGVVCQITAPDFGTSTITHIGVLGASVANSAGQLEIYRATTTYNATTGLIATSSGTLLARDAINDGVAIQFVASSTLLDGTDFRFTQGDVLIFDYNGTSTIGVNHVGLSTCTAKFDEL